MMMMRRRRRKKTTSCDWLMMTMMRWIILPGQIRLMKMIDGEAEMSSCLPSSLPI